MTKRLLCAVFLVSAIVLAIGVVLCAGVLAAYVPSGLLFDLAGPMILVLVITLAIGLLLAWASAKRLVQPIHRLDPEHPERYDSYDELKPLLKKISKQNKTIRNQMVDLFRQQQTFDTIAANMTEGMLVLDVDANILSYNSAASRLLNMADDGEGRSVFLLHRSPALREVVEEAIAGQHHQQIMPFAERTYQLIGNPVMDNDRTIGAVLTILDVTERAERDRLRQEFSANVSHELKTPLTSISGFAEIMMTGVAKPEDMQQFAGRIYDEAGRLITLIGDIIQLSRLDEGNLSAQIQPVNLFGIAETVVERLKSNSNKSGIQIALQGNRCMVNGVPQMLEEMLTNLCDNAIKYNTPGGSVTVAVLPRESDVLLAVTDTGIGIPYDEQERVFERFYRVDKSHSKQIGGTGLGLSIVKHVALFHKAKLNLESTPGEGTCITVSFPKVD